MKKLLMVIFGSLVLGIAAGAGLFLINHVNVEEHFEPYNMNTETDEIRPSL